MAEVRGQESEVRNQEGPGPAFLRPLLAVSRADIEAYARQQDLRWIEDESNADTGYSRNFLRREVLPLIEGRFPAYRSNFASAALHCGEASELLDDLATIDARQMIRDGRLAVDALASLSPPRSKNLLRYFIHSHGLPMPDQDRLREMLRQLVTARDDAQVCLVHGGRELRRFNGQLYLLQPQSALTAEAALCWQGQPGLALAQLGGSLHFERTRGTGVAAHLLLNKPYSIRFRRGGERLRLRACGPSRSLKNLFQESALPPWERERLPLLFFDDTLAVVPGIGVHAPFQCPPDEAGVLIHWLAGDRDN